MVGAGGATVSTGLGLTGAITSLTKEKPARRAAALLSFEDDRLDPNSESLRIGSRAAQTSGDSMSTVGVYVGSLFLRWL